VADSLDSFFRPRAVAVIGASRNPDSMSGTLLKNLLTSFHGPVYPVNPQAESIQSVLCYPSIRDVPQPIDLAFITVPRSAVLAVVQDCIAAGLRSLVVISAGFSETDAAGKDQQLQLGRLARDAEVRLLGPNCLGLLNTAPGAAMNGTFSHGQPDAGNAAIATQSGALGFVFPEYMHQWQLGISQLVSLGNKLDIGENDLLRHWEHESDTKVIQLYLESFQAPREFLEVARRISQRIPIVALKAGQTQAGTRAAASHTAALAGSTVAATGLLRQAGIIQVRSLEELFATTALFSMQPPPLGTRVGILTNAGGPGVLCADALESLGLEVPQLSPSVQRRLGECVPAEATVTNPIDLIGSTDPVQFGNCLDVLLASDELDAVVAIYVPRLANTSEAIAQSIRASASAHPGEKTLLAVIMESGPVPASLSTGTERIPCYRYPESAARALAHARRWSAWRDATRIHERPPVAIRSTEVRDLVDRHLQQVGDGWLDVESAQRLLTGCGLSLPAWRVADSGQTAVVAAEEIGFPIVLKAIAPGLLHKTDVGGVILDLHRRDEVHHAWTQLRERVPELTGVMVQRFVSAPHEVMIGISRDEQFGHLISFGLGGVMVEAWGDMHVRLPPLCRWDADDLIQESMAARTLVVTRGESMADVAAVRDALLRISDLVQLVPEICEADFNPIAVHAAGAGIDVLDVRIRLHAR